METFLLILTSLIGALGFAVVFRTPRRYLVHTTFVGFMSSILIRSMPPHWHLGYTSFAVAFFISSLSHLFARFTRAPAQCFLIPGVIFLVPGTLIYRSFTKAIDSNLREAATLGLIAISVTFGISFGLLIANWLVPSRKTL